MRRPPPIFGGKARLLLSNVFWSGAGRAARLLGALASSVLIARHLGADRYGLLCYIVSFALLFEIIAQFGTDNVVTLEIAKKQTPPDVILGTALAVRTCASLVAMLVLSLCVAVFEPDTRVALAILAFSTSFLAHALLVTRNYFVATLANQHVAAAEILALFISLGVKAALVFVDAPMKWFLASLVFDAFLLSALLLFFYNRRCARLLNWRVNFTWAKYLVKESAPLALSLAAVMIHQRIDQVMLRNMVGAASVGQYAVAVKIVSVVLFLPRIVAETFSPFLVRAKQHSEALFDRRFYLMATTLLWLAVAGAIATSLLAAPTVRVLFGDEFREAAGLVQILVWKTVLVALSVSSAHWIIIARKQRLIVLRGLAGCCLNIPLNLLLIPKYGATGASVATLISFFFGSYAAHFFIPGYRRLFWVQTSTIFKGPSVVLASLRAEYRERSEPRQ